MPSPSSREERKLMRLRGSGLKDRELKTATFDFSFSGTSSMSPGSRSLSKQTQAAKRHSSASAATIGFPMSESKSSAAVSSASRPSTASSAITGAPAKRKHKAANEQRTADQIKRPKQQPETADRLLGVDQPSGKASKRSTDEREKTRKKDHVPCGPPDPRTMRYEDVADDIASARWRSTGSRSESRPKVVKSASSKKHGELLLDLDTSTSRPTPATTSSDSNARLPPPPPQKESRERHARRPLQTLQNISFSPVSRSTVQAKTSTKPTATASKGKAIQPPRRHFAEWEDGDAIRDLPMPVIPSALSTGPLRGGSEANRTKTKLLGSKFVFKF